MLLLGLSCLPVVCVSGGDAGAAQKAKCAHQEQVMVTPSGIVTPRYSPFSHLYSYISLAKWRQAAPCQSTPNARTPIPYDIVNADVAKVAITQVNKRLDGHLALKTATESRAMVLATNCVAVLIVVTGAAMFDFKTNGFSALVVAGITGATSLFISLMFAYLVIRPNTIVLPGHLPSDIWHDITDPNMNGKDFMLRLIASSQQDMEKNERMQDQKGTRLRVAIALVILSVPLSAISFFVARQFL
jgi:hypothetical protein